MGKFDVQIAWLQDCIDFGRHTIEDLESGKVRQSTKRDGRWVDISQELIDEARGMIARYTRLIEAYKARESASE